MKVWLMEEVRFAGYAEALCGCGKAMTCLRITRLLPANLCLAPILASTFPWNRLLFICPFSFHAILVCCLVREILFPQLFDVAAAGFMQLFDTSDVAQANFKDFFERSLHIASSYFTCIQLRRHSFHINKISLAPFLHVAPLARRSSTCSIGPAYLNQSVAS